MKRTMFNYLKLARINKGEIIQNTNNSDETLEENTDNEISNFLINGNKVDFILDNFPFPIIVVGCKTEQLIANELINEAANLPNKEVLAQLRTVCLNVGASLSFTSSTNDVNISKLKKYFMHRLYSESIAMELSIEVFYLFIYIYLCFFIFIFW
jgi:hypothetical protein